jgi:hypothetical protein
MGRCFWVLKVLWVDTEKVAMEACNVEMSSGCSRPFFYHLNHVHIHALYVKLLQAQSLSV